jgi:hypothetical protein
LRRVGVPTVVLADRIEPEEKNIEDKISRKKKSRFFQKQRFPCIRRSADGLVCLFAPLDFD